MLKSLHQIESKVRLGIERRYFEMKCPRCGRASLDEFQAGVRCKTCGYILSAGEADRFRLYRLLGEEAQRGRL